MVAAVKVAAVAVTVKWNMCGCSLALLPSPFFKTEKLSNVLQVEGLKSINQDPNVNEKNP